jgi:hypothetical protein
MKGWSKFILILIVFGLLIIFSKDLVAKSVITGTIKAITGLSLDIKSVKVGLLTTNIEVEGLKLHNPPNYQDKTMVDIPQIYINYNLGAFLKKKIYLQKLKLYLKEFVIVKDKDGKLNLNSLKIIEEKEKKPKPEEKKEKLPPMQIDVLELKIDRVLYKDYSQGVPPKVKEYNIYLNERYTDISDPQKLAELIIYKAMIKTTIAKLVDFNLDLLGEDLKGVLKKTTTILGESATKTLEVGGEKIEEVGKKALKESKEATEEAVEKLKKALEGIKMPIIERKQE